MLCSPVGSLRRGSSRCRQVVTADKASAPGSIEKLRPTAREELQTPAGSSVSGPNKVATIIPTARKSYTKPKRLNQVQLDYPGVLKAQGIEGNVVVQVPEWDDQWVQIKLEQSAVFTGEGVVYLAGRQTRWHLIR